MSAICQNFVQNAWKKELCSNCFKSKDEHLEKSQILKPLIRSDKIISSIIKNAAKINKPKYTVSFMSELSKVIGYGGEDWSETEEDFMSNEDTSEDNEYEADGEEEKELQKLTKANTDFNTVNANLLKDSSPEPKKSFATLKLGAPQLDSEGRKQTLLVSVTPFGEDSSSSRRYIKSISHIPVAKNTKETVLENKKNVVLTSYTNKEDTKKEDTKKEETEKSLLEEISETLEKGSNRISIMDCKLPENMTVSEINEKNLEGNKEDKDRNIATSNNTSESVLEEISDKTKEQKNKTNISERKVLLTRAPVIKRSTAKLELYNTKSSKIRSSKENISNTKNTEKEVNNEHTIKCDQSKVEAKSLNKEKESHQVEQKELDTQKQDLQKDENDNEKHSDSEESNKTDSTTDTDNYEDISVSDTNNSLTESLKDEEDDNKFNQTEKPLENVTKYTDAKEPGSRELAGEPDGHADPDGNSDAPALPSTPPPFETRTSFLHGPGSEKPKPPSKPSTVLIRKPAVVTNQHVNAVGQQNILSTFSSEPHKNTIESPKQVPTKNLFESQKTKLSKQDSTGSDYGRTSSNKRRAPMPPPTEEMGTYSKKPMAPFPEVLESEKKERAASCSPCLRSEISDTPSNEPRLEKYVSTSESGPRKGISISSDNLANTKTEDKKKDKTKGRFSLKKFLRMNSTKEVSKDVLDDPKVESSKHNSDSKNSNSKQRLVIVHPSELNGEKIEVVAKPIIPPEVADYSPLNTMQNGIYNSNGSLHGGHIYENRSFKPAPPPRNLEVYSPAAKPNLPQPPKSAELTAKQKNIRSSSPKSQDSVYANIGEVRSAIIPNKPQRTASMREREALAAAQAQKSKNSHVYEPINVRAKDANENVYDYINGVRSSSPECDSSSPTKNSPVANTGRIRKALGQGKFSSNIDVSGESYKYNNNIPRSASLTYCGSETESEIYSPYGFYNGDGEVYDDDREWSIPGSRTHKLRSRKGRSIVHKNLEDNYGAVVVANHEALAQVLENIQHTPTILPALRGLKTATNLRWSDFSLKETVPPLILGPRVFHQGMWGAHHVTLVVNVGTIPSSSLSLGNYNLIPITEFVDLIPTQDLPSVFEKETDNIQATIAVHPWMQVHSVKSYSDFLKSRTHPAEDIKKEASFTILQLVNALKMLQAQGIEELPASLSTFVLCKETDKESYYRVCVLQGLGEDPTHKREETNLVSLCMCATTALMQLMPDSKLTSLLRALLSTERAVSLTQVKSVLEFSLWGPSDVILSSNIKERELALQRWLDLQRATVLHGLVCTKVQLTVYEECHLLFLVRSNSKMICDASLLLDSVHMQSNVSKA